MDRRVRHPDRPAEVHLRVPCRWRDRHRHGHKDRGATAITEGKIDGDTITFVEALSFNGMDIKITYTGKIDGDTIKFTRQVGDFATEELTAKRVK
jgi:hypothetical protein